MTQAANLAALGTNAGTTGILPAAGGGTGTSAGVTGFKNRIINGDMTIAQRGTSAVTTDESFPVDRFQLQIVNANLSLVQSSTAPAGFNYSIAATVTSTTSTNANDRSRLFQNIEGFNVADLDWGTANAKTITVSFWARSTVTGTYSGNITNNGGNRSYIFTYALTANTWTYVTATVPGDTSGTWGKTNGNGLGFNPITFNCGSNFQGTDGSWIAGDKRGTSGSTYLATSNSGAVFNITGVQLEVGTAATNFDVRSYVTELQLCQRYFQGTTNPNDGNNYYYGSGSNLTSSIAYITYPFLVSMRTSPTLTSSGTFYIRGGGNSELVTSVSLVASTTTTAGVNFTVGGATLTQGYGVLARSSTSSANTLFFSAEL